MRHRSARLLLAVAMAALAFGAGACSAAVQPVELPEGCKQFHVADFGAVPDDGADDTDAVTRAASAAAAQANSALIFAPGRYDFDSTKRPGKGSHQIAVTGARGLIIDGRGALLAFAGRTGSFLLEDCHDLSVANLTIDWDEPLYSQGLIVRADDDSFDVKLDRLYTGEGCEQFESIIEFDPRTRWPMPGGRDVHDLPGAPDPSIGRREKIAPDTLRIHMTRKRRMTAVALAVIRHQVYVYNAFRVSECDRLELRDVTIHYAPGMGVSARLCQDVLLKRLRIVPRPGRILSTSSDGTHFSECSGTIRIEDCTFQGMGDDATNIHGYYLNVVALPGGRVVEAKCKNTWIMPPDVGDTMEFTDPQTLLPYAAGRVEKVEVDRPSKVHRITFEAPLPEGLEVGHFLADSTRVPKVRIRGNRVTGNRARGFVIKTRDAVIEDNVLRGVSSAGIFVAAEGNHWRESIATRNVVVRNNRMIECNGGPSRRWAAISVFALVEGGKEGGTGVHRDVRIENNRIEGTDNGGIYVSAADGVQVAGNTIVACCRQPTRPAGDAAITLAGCRHVTIRGNTLRRPGEGLRAAIAYGRNAERDTVAVAGNTGFGPGE